MPAAPVGGRRLRARRRSRARPLVLLLAAALVAVVVGPASTAQAHAFLAGSNPADGQVLTAAPRQLRLDFSESVVLSATRIDIVDAEGRHLAPTGMTLVARDDTGDSGDTEEPVEVVAALPTLHRSSYRVSWETLSSDDLHRTSGVLVFGVGQAVTAGGLDEPAPPPLEAALRWLVLLGLSGALGGSLALHLLAPASAVGPPAPGAASAVALARRCSVAGAATAVVGALVLLVTQLSLGGSWALPLLWSGYGLRWGLRELGLLVVLGAALARPRLPRSAAGWAPLGTGTALACVGAALLGHSGTGRSPDPTRVLASAAHLGAAATWAGCVTVLALVLAPRVRRDAAARESARAVLQRFGPAATVCVAVLVVTGVYLSSEVVGSVDAAVSTVYGRTLLLKVTLAAVAGALALVNTVQLRRRSRRSTPRRTVLAEAAAAVGVLALAAILTSGQPAMEPQLVQSAIRSTDGLVDRKVADLQETVSIRPNRPGPNIVLVDVFDTRRPAPSPVRGVVVSLIPPGDPSGAPLRAEPLGDGRWSVSTTLEAAGAVTVHVAVQRVDLPDTTATYGWTVGGAPEQTRPAVVSTAPLGPGLRVAAGLLLFALLGAGVLALAVRLLGRRTPGPRSPDRPVPVTSPEPDEAQAQRRPDPVRQ
jgi:copper transport protein